MTGSASFTVEAVEAAADSWRPSLRGRAVVRLGDLVRFEVEIISGKKGLFCAFPARRVEHEDREPKWITVVKLTDASLEREVFAEARKRFEEMKNTKPAEPAPEGGISGLPF